MLCDPDQVLGPIPSGSPLHLVTLHRTQSLRGSITDVVRSQPQGQFPGIPGFTVLGRDTAVS